jgi:twitching motility protein PilT
MNQSQCKTVTVYGGMRMNSKLIGELLVDCQCITREQLSQALRYQEQKGGRLGSLLLEMGYVSIDDLLKILEKTYEVPTVNLQKLCIDPAVLSLVPLELMTKYKILPIADGVKSIFIAMVNPHDLALVEEIQFKLGKTVQPVAVPFSQMENALACLRSHNGDLSKPFNGSELACPITKADAASDQPLMGLFARLVEGNASDLLLSPGVPPCLKMNNEIVRLGGEPLTAGQLEVYAQELMNAEQFLEFQARGDIDFGKTFAELGRFRINIYKQRGSVSMAVRCVLDEIPEFARLGLPDWIREYALRSQGLILITGPTGHGKSTTLTSLVDIINSSRRCNIISVEDPIEHLHRHKLSNVNQREVGKDTDSFQEGLKRVFRQAPDVIVVGEMRDPESFAMALQAAETGHLVISTMHANSSTSAIERIIDIFPPGQQQQTRVQLADSFLLIMNQRLVARRDGKGRVLAYEKLLNTPRVRKMIREGKTHQIRSQFLQGQDEFQIMDMSLARLVSDGMITSEEAMKFCENPNLFKETLMQYGTSNRRQ